MQDPTKVLEESLEGIKKDRAFYRALYMPVVDMFTAKEMDELRNAFESVAGEDEIVDYLQLKTMFKQVDIYPDDETLQKVLKDTSIGALNENQIDFERFARITAILVEDISNYTANLAKKE